MDLLTLHPSSPLVHCGPPHPPITPSTPSTATHHTTPCTALHYPAPAPPLPHEKHVRSARTTSGLGVRGIKREELGTQLLGGLLVCSFACWFVCLSAGTFVCLWFVCLWFVCLFVGLYLFLMICLFVCWLVCLFPC